ncbi:MAG TPA: hypothetical protein VMR97_10005 [Acidimicrobiales bacterium]|nr:hypothetical protein [Acidimicrobiales bacterium]
MATLSANGKSIIVEGLVHAWHHEGSQEIRWAWEDPDLTHPNSGPRLLGAFSWNLRSANYDPENANRLILAGEHLGWAYGPGGLVPEGPRRIDRRGCFRFLG